MFQIRSEDAKYCPLFGGGVSPAEPQEIKNRRGSLKKKEGKQRGKGGESKAAHCASVVVSNRPSLFMWRPHFFFSFLTTFNLENHLPLCTLHYEKLCKLSHNMIFFFF